NAMADVPTMAEQGYPQLDSGAWMGIAAPAVTPRALTDRQRAAHCQAAGTPRAVIDSVQWEIARAAKAPGISAKLADQAVELASSTPEEFAAFIRAEHDNWGKHIRDAKRDLTQ